jgi:CheY-like chemotaxis protein
MDKWRILIVDDEEDVRTVLRATLADDYEVIEAHDGLDALEKVRRSEPDLVLMDVMMPLMDGFEACRAIRNTPEFREIPVMFLTALSGKEDMKKGYGAGANLYLTKPFEPERLLKNLDVFFKTTPPQRSAKRFTITDLRSREGQEPVAPGAMEFAPSQRDSDSQAGQSQRVRPRVLVTDDDADIIAVMKTALGQTVEVVYAMDGIQAIERLVKYQPDIAVMDIMLPKMSGFQLIQSLRANKAFAKLPILVCSAKSTEKDIQFARRLGANGFLPKPFHPEQLQNMIADMVMEPGFRVRPKNLPIEEFITEVGGVSADSTEVQTLGADGRRLEQSKETIGSFLNKEGQKDAFDRDDEEKKRKKLFFGFGRK